VTEIPCAQGAVAGKQSPVSAIPLLIEQTHRRYSVREITPWIQPICLGFMRFPYPIFPSVFFLWLQCAADKRFLAGLCLASFLTGFVLESQLCNSHFLNGDKLKNQKGGSYGTLEPADTGRE
jgi:hypothetical protein